ncbi:GNAT family N-acetyltransferase [Kineosporiaceae bacterium SCSIO 59966]|nr:GNAT family N-acetyltransferase [Kineosporiaceae bacterium SCSIO 59966]
MPRVETPDVLTGPGADASVRAATAGDVPAIGAVHSRAWRTAYSGLLPAEVLEALAPEALAEAWRPAVSAPPSPGHRVLVAAAGPTVVGFAAAEPDGEVVALLVDPAHQRRGHGSRLLNAVADLLREAGGERIGTWTPEQDAPRLAFLRTSGLEPDGRRRTLELPGGATLEEVHLHAGLAS